MDKTYYYNYLKDYILEVGDRIAGFDKDILKDSDALHEFIDDRAQLAVEEYERNSELLGGCGQELAMQTLLADLTDLEADEDDIWHDGDDPLTEENGGNRPECRIIIAGSRSFDDYDLLRRECNNYLGGSKDRYKFVILSGGAKGADRLGERYAEECGFDIEWHHANWKKYGRSAGIKRNKEMAKRADVLIAFWDGFSHGTKNMIKTAKEADLIVKTIMVNPGTVQCFSDYETRYFQVEEGGKDYILIQRNKPGDDDTAVPHRIDDNSPSDMKPVCEGINWSLERCIGVMETRFYFNRLIDDSEGKPEVIEVEPHFKKVVDKDLPPNVIKVNRVVAPVTILPPLPNPTVELEKMVGCDEIKRKMVDLKSLTAYNKVCFEHSPEIPVMKIFLHSLFYGNPGTGKTTMCRLYGSLLKDAGILSKGHVVVADRSVFVGDCFGDTEAILNELLNYSQGGVLMFDEAYLLEGNHPSDPNKMILPMLLSALADDNNKDFAVVLCGYKDKLDKMIDKNPGLHSRFINRFEFKDYSLDELTEIGKRYLRSYGHTFSASGLKKFREELSIAMTGNRTTWANARSVKSMIDNTYIQRAKRFAREGKYEREITAEDISTIPVDTRRKLGF